MTWVRGDDQAADHPKVLRAQSSPRPKGLVLGPEAFAAFVYGTVDLCAAWSASKQLDGWVTEAAMRRVAGVDAALAAKSAVRAGMLGARERRDGEWGWWINQDDFLWNIKSKAEVDAEKRYRKQLRDPEVYGPVRKRDGDQCRYCGKTVMWKDNRSARGGLIEHVITGGDELVVACRECNGKKGSNSPEDAGLTLNPPPVEPFYSAYTRELLIKHGYLEQDTAAATTRPAPDPAAATTLLELETREVLERTTPPVLARDVRTGTDDQRAGPDPGATDRGLPDQRLAGSGRDGPGSGLAGRPAVPSSALAVPTRRKRARRGTPGPAGEETS